MFPLFQKFCRTKLFFFCNKTSFMTAILSREEGPVRECQITFLYYIMEISCMLHSPKYIFYFLSGACSQTVCSLSHHWAHLLLLLFFLFLLAASHFMSYLVLLFLKIYCDGLSVSMNNNSIHPPLKNSPLLMKK
jgi:hypothetical protein